MKNSSFIYLTIFFLFSQRLLSDDAPVIGSMVKTWTFEQITNTLREVKEIWEEPSDAFISQSDRILRLKPDDPQALRAFFAGVSELSLSSDKTDLRISGSQLQVKWRTMSHLADFVPPLGNEPETWEMLAVMVGLVRPQITPNYQPLGKALNWIETPGEDHQAKIDANRKKIAMDYFQARLRDIERSWTNIPINRIRHLASKMHLDERKQFLDKIKELARSDEEEAKQLDEPIVLEKVKYPSVEVMRRFLSRMSPDKRKQTIEVIRQKSDYTEEQIKLLEASFE